MRVFPNIKPVLKTTVAAADWLTRWQAARRCDDLYDGDNLGAFRREHGDVDVMLVAPPMADREGALIHPGIQILQTILRRRGIGCEVLNYNLPVANPLHPIEHLSRAIEVLGVRILGISLYSQAIQTTMRQLAWLKERHSGLTIVLGGPHPTEAYLSLLGLRFIDYVVRSEAEESLPALCETLLAGNAPGDEIAGIFWFDRATGAIRGKSADFIDVEAHDREGLLTYELRDDEISHYRRFRGAHGLVGPRYWPTSVVRGCPYACTYCAAKVMSGKRLRYREVDAVIAELEHYRRAYGQRHFSMVDDAFTQDYGYVRRFCEAILARGLDIEWTTDNGIRYESLGSGAQVQRFLEESGMGTIEAMIDLMFDAGWRGTSIGIESGSPRVRRDLVRKGGRLLTNDEIVDALAHLKSQALARGIDFYINGYLMVGFPPLNLPNGRCIDGESAEEANQTFDFAVLLQRAGALDFVNLSIVIPLPGTDMWDHLDIGQRMQILIAGVAPDHPEAAEIDTIVAEQVATHADLAATRYDEQIERGFWLRIYRLSDDAQIAINGAYDAFNADAAYRITLDRPDGAALFAMRQRLLENFYGGITKEFKLIRHIVRRTESLRDFLVYFSYFCRTYMPDMKATQAPMSASKKRLVP
ncbi:hypothetical protein BH10PSE12_BH10PSE12_15650 [soil metagenome]